MGYIKAKEIAEDLGIAKITAIKYIQEGFLPAELMYDRKQPYYAIDEDEYKKWKNKHFKGLRRGKISRHNRLTKELNLPQLKKLAQGWLDWCKTGKLTGKPVKERTLEIYEYYFNQYLRELGHYPPKPIISINNLREVLGSLSVESYSTKRNIYDAIRSFAKYLQENDYTLEEGRFDEQLKKLRPKRFLPAKKTSATEKQIAKLLQAIDDMPKCNSSDFDRLNTKTIVTVLANTGLRSSELCSLKISDIDLEAKKLYVVLGKGNKNRQVGLTEDTCSLLTEYLKCRLDMKVNHDYFFINKLGNRFNNKSLGKKIKRLGDKAGIDITPHGLRRSFVTINAGKGKPLNHLRIACGHSDLSTTQGYCMTSVDEVVEAMKNW